MGIRWRVTRARGGLVGAIKRVTDPLTGGIGGAKRPAP